MLRRWRKNIIFLNNIKSGSLDAGSIDRRRGTVELSFYFTKEQGDSILWVECVERVPLALIDTALCRRWFDDGG